MPSAFRIVIVLAALLAAGASAAFAQTSAPRRTALVIGNAGYAVSPLTNPINDARAMARTLRKLGFDVIERIDADQAEMKRAIWDFGRKLRDGGVGLFYFAGHGVQVDGENYLIPLNGRIEQEPDLELEAVRVTRVLAEMEKAGNGMNIVILDACRNNPFARSFRSYTRGLAQMSAPYGTLLAYATSPGAVAADGEGENGLYTSELLAAITVPGLRVEDVFKTVRREVRKKSQGQQIPWESTSIEGDFYFVPPPPKPVPPAAARPAPPSKPATALSVSPSALEYAFWQSIEDSKNPEDYRAYLEQYPEGTFAALAKNRIERLKPEASRPAKPAGSAPPEKEAKAAAATQGPSTPAIIAMERNFVTVAEATLRAQPSADSAAVGTVSAASAVIVTGKTRDSDWYRVRGSRGRSAFVHGDLIAPVGASEIARWERIKHSRNPADFREFLERYPRSAIAPTARLYLAQAEERRRTAAGTAADPGPEQNGARKRSPAGQAFREVWSETRSAWRDAMGLFRSSDEEKPVQPPPSQPGVTPVTADPPAPSFAPGSHVRVDSNRLNVRDGPGDEFDVLFTVEEGDVLQVNQQNASWVRIETSDSRTGWVAGWLVSAAEETRQAASTPRGEPATVTRSISGGDDAVSAPARTEDPVERLRQLKRLHEQGLISEAEYNSKRQEILSNL